MDLKNPSKTFVVLFTRQSCLFGVLLYSIDKKNFEERRPHLRPFFSPGVILPKFARAIVNLSRVKGKDVFLDPFCGTGGILLEAGMIGARIIGIDAQEKMVRGAKENLSFYGLSSDLIHGDASKMALKDNSVDSIATDIPYGRSSSIAGYSISEHYSLERLYTDSMNEIHRVLKSKGKAVIVSNSPSPYPYEHNFRIIEKHEYRVHRSLNRYITVLEKR